MAQTGSDPGIRLRGDLPKPSARLLDWCANPPGDRRECGRPPTCSELACCGGRRPRVTIVVQTLWPAASSCRDHGSNRGRRPPRVAIAGSTPWLYLEGAASSCRHRGSNRGFSRLTWFAQPTLLSLLWYKPGVRLPPRVANMVQTPGETLAGKPVDVSISMG